MAQTQDLTMSPEARIQILAIRAHAEVETAQRLIASYRRKAKTLTTKTYQPMLAALADALEALTKANDNWQTIDVIIWNEGGRFSEMRQQPVSDSELLEVAKQPKHA